MACEFPVAVKAKLMLTAIHCLLYFLLINYIFIENPFRSFGTTEGLNLAIPITLAVGYYDSLYYHTSRDHCLECGRLR